MNDEFTPLRSALRTTTPQAPESIRQETISAAMVAFDDYHQTQTDAKLIAKNNHKLYDAILRKLTMTLSRPSLALAGTAVVFAVAGLISYQTFISVQSPVLIESESELGWQTDQHDRQASPWSIDEKLQLNGMASSTQITPALSPYVSESMMDFDQSDQNHDRFATVAPNQIKLVSQEPVSTFSIDVDTASYAYLRSALNEGWLPESDTIRTEEMINYFAYNYSPPETRSMPIATYVSLMPSPWNESTKLMHIGIKGYELAQSEVPPANLVFLIDTSGSMSEPNKLPLLKRSFRLLLTALAPDDRVAIVTYAGHAGIALQPTPVSDRAKILASLDDLYSEGSTAGSEGILKAYRLAEQHMVDGGINRVILATDGDFNVGLTDLDELEQLIKRKRSNGISLSVLGFGMGNYNDELMQRLAQHGNGNAAFIDTLSEARKVLLEQVTSTLVALAKDVKIQIEFNPEKVQEYRLIGYETRMLDREDFNNDRVDSGEIGAGHTITAIYELALVNTTGRLISPLRYQHAKPETSREFSDEYAFLQIRYKHPSRDSSELISRSITERDVFEKFDEAPDDVRFSVAVAGFGQMLHSNRYTGSFGYEDVVSLARDARGDDEFGYRSEFVRLVELAESISKTEQ